MADEITTTASKATLKPGKEPSKRELQREMERARESLGETVDQIRDTVGKQYESVKETVAGVVNYREEFSKEPLVWSLGALSAGFALGYTMGYAHKNARSSTRKHSELEAFTSSLVEELQTVGNSLVMPTLNSRIKTLFGFDFSDLLAEIRSTDGSKPRGARKTANRTKKKATKSRDTKRTSKRKKRSQ
jgi:hypothetical protein